MMKYFLMLLAILSVVYGILVLQVGSGTSFWIIWEAMGFFFFFWAFLLHKEFFATHPKIGITFHLMIAAGVIVLAILCGMIGRSFAVQGEKNLDYLIILGAQVREDGPSAALKYRLDAAITYLNKNPDTICIVSGGQGKNEPYSEAEGMSDYLLEHGIDKNRILLEDQSKNTLENIQNSKKLLEFPYNGIGIVTNNFHVFRALQIAKEQGIEGACGIAADSNILYLPNNVLRECFGILKNWILT